MNRFNDEKQFSRRPSLIDISDGKDSGKPELVRPLPWLLFLPSLVMLRVVRMTVNIGASILGYSKVTPCGMVCPFSRDSQFNINIMVINLKKK